MKKKPREVWVGKRKFSSSALEQMHQTNKKKSRGKSLRIIHRIEVRLEQKLLQESAEAVSFPARWARVALTHHALRVMTSTQFNNMAFGNDTFVDISIFGSILASFIV